MLHIKKIKPLFNNLITTAEKFEKDMIDGNIIMAKKGDLKTWQRVIAVGSCVRDIEVGDMVMVNMENYAVKKYSKDSIQNDLDNNSTVRYAFNWVEIDDEKGEPQECLLFSDRDIMYVFEGEEKDDTIMVPKKTRLIVS